jgi:hypothetical protein
MARLEVENLPHIINHKKNNCMNVKRAAEYGHLEMLKWMVENGFKFTGDALTAAAERGTAGMRRVLARARVQHNSYGLKSDGKSRPDPRAAMGHRKRLQVGAAVDPGSA